MVYAQIDNNIIVNTIVIDDPALIPLFSTGHNMFLQIDNLNPMPLIGWIYDINNCSFSPPLPLSQKIVSDCMDCGNQVILQWGALNIEGGMYAAGQTVAFLAYVGQLFQLLSYGYLNDAMDAMNVMVADTGPTKAGLAPFLTDDILIDFQSQIQTCLNSLPPLN